MPSSTLSQIEAETSRQITISTTSTSTYNPQPHSPFFTLLPAELRNIIFELATLPSPSPTQTLPVLDHSYRPDYTAKPLHHTALLQTCRRIWLETHALPLKQATHHFWFTAKERGCALYGPKFPDDELDRFKAFLARLTPLGRARVAHVQFYTNISSDHGGIGQLAPPLRELVGPPAVVPEGFTLTVRHCDWWGWWREDGGVVKLHVGHVEFCLKVLAGMGLRRVRIEVEAEVGRRKELVEVVEDLKGLEVVEQTEEGAEAGACSRRLVLDGEAEERAWEKDVEVYLEDFYRVGDEGEGVERKKFCVFTLTWRREMRNADVRGPSGLAGIGAAESNSDLSSQSEDAVAAVNRYRKQWAESGSLLKFVGDE